MKLLKNEKGLEKPKIFQRRLFMIFTIFLLMSSLVSAQDINNIKLLEDTIQDTLEETPLLSSFIKDSEICVIVHKDNEIYSFEVDYDGENVDAKYNQNFMCDGSSQEDFIINFVNYGYFENLGEQLEQFSLRKIGSLVSLILLGAKMDYYHILPSKFLEVGGKLIWDSESESKYSSLFKFAGKYTKGKSTSTERRPYSQGYSRYSPEPEPAEQPIGNEVEIIEEEEEFVEVIEVEELPEEETVTPPKPNLPPFEETAEEEVEEENLVIKDIYIADIEKTIDEKRPYSMRIDRRSISE